MVSALAAREGYTVIFQQADAIGICFYIPGNLSDPRYQRQTIIQKGVYMSVYRIVYYFLIYSAIGWMTEVAYHAVTMKKVINRGMLNGPVCPIYGFGVLSFLWLLSEIDLRLPGGGSNTAVVFFTGMILCSLIELAGGWLIDVLFHQRFWDYSDVPFNLHGYICLRFSIFWGIGTVIVMKIVHPLIASLPFLNHETWIAWTVAAAMYAVYLTDFVITVMTIAGLNRKLKEIDEIRADIRSVSDDLSEKIGTHAIDTAEKIDAASEKADQIRTDMNRAVNEQKQITENNIREIRDELKSYGDEYRAKKEEERRALLAKLEAKRTELLGWRLSTLRRYLKAYPQMSSRDHEEVIRLLREQIRELAETKK